MKVISGSSNTAVAEKIAQNLGIELVDVSISKFPNGEKRIWIKEKLHGENVILVQSLSDPVDEHVVETLLLTDALERLGVRHVNLVMPWMGYSLQDKLFREGEAIAAKVVANLLSNAYIKRIFLLDLHNTSTPGFFSIPTHHISALSLFTDFVKENLSQNYIVASPDFGGLKRARVFADELEVDLVNIDKHRDLHTGAVEAVDIQGGSVAGKDVVLFDDVIVSGGTVAESAKLLKEQGANDIYFLATHGIFVDGAFEKMNQAPLTKVVITDSITHQNLPDYVEIIPSGKLFSSALKTWM